MTICVSCGATVSFCKSTLKISPALCNADPMTSEACLQDEFLFIVTVNHLPLVYMWEGWIQSCLGTGMLQYILCGHGGVIEHDISIECLHHQWHKDHLS